MLQNYPWPGNVRELENVVQRAVVLSGGRTITPAHLMFDDAAMDSQAAPAVDAFALQAMPVQALPVQAMPAQVLPMPRRMSCASDANTARDVQPNACCAHGGCSASHVVCRLQATTHSLPHLLKCAKPTVPVNLEHAVKTSELQVIMAAIQSTDSRMAAAAKVGHQPPHPALQAGANA